MNGDSFCRFNAEEFRKFHFDKKAFASIVVAKSETTEDYGSIILDDKDRVVSFSEKIKSQVSRTYVASICGGPSKY